MRRGRGRRPGPRAGRGKPACGDRHGQGRPLDQPRPGDGRGCRRIWRAPAPSRCTGAGVMNPGTLAAVGADTPPAGSGRNPASRQNPRPSRRHQGQPARTGFTRSFSALRRVLGTGAPPPTTLRRAQILRVIPGPGRTLPARRPKPAPAVTPGAGLGQRASPALRCHQASSHRQTARTAPHRTAPPGHHGLKQVHDLGGPGEPGGHLGGNGLTGQPPDCPAPAGTAAATAALRCPQASSHRETARTAPHRTAPHNQVTTA